MVPFEQLAGGTGGFNSGDHLERLIVERVVVTAVLKFFVNAAADFDAVIERHPQIAYRATAGALRNGGECEACQGHGSP